MMNKSVLKIVQRSSPGSVACDAFVCWASLFCDWGVGLERASRASLWRLHGPLFSGLLLKGAAPPPTHIFLCGC